MSNPWNKIIVRYSWIGRQNAQVNQLKECQFTWIVMGWFTLYDTCVFIGRCFQHERPFLKTIKTRWLCCLSLLMAQKKHTKQQQQPTIILYKHLNPNGIIAIVSIKYHKPLQKEKPNGRKPRRMKTHKNISIKIAKRRKKQRRNWLKIIAKRL